jgi:hypothetical protein
MTYDHHVKAQDLSSHASIRSAQGDEVAASELYCRAALHEIEAFLSVPADKPRTRGVYAVSLVSMLYKAYEYELVKGWCNRLLQEDWIKAEEKWVRVQLQELFDLSDRCEPGEQVPQRQ